MNIDEAITVTIEVNDAVPDTEEPWQNSLHHYNSTHTVVIGDITVAMEYTCKVIIQSKSTSMYIMANDYSVASTGLIVQGL